MSDRDEALKKAKALEPKRNSLAGYIRELTLRGFFDSSKQSRDVIKAVRDQFGRRFPVSYVQTYMKSFLQAGILQTQDSADGRGNAWLGSWLKHSEHCPYSTGERLRLKVDTTGWNAEVAEDFQLGLSCYATKLWKPAAVMVRRAYEGSLILKYQLVEGRVPDKQGTCPKCSTKLGTRPLSITDLHY